MLGGGTPYASFQSLAHGWGRAKGFHSSLINEVCERRGDIIRKRKHEIEAEQKAPKLPPSSSGSQTVAEVTAIMERMREGKTPLPAEGTSGQPPNQSEQG